MDTTDHPAEVIDPDPFSVGIGIFGAVAGAGAWLEARRQRADSENKSRQDYRAAWFACVRSVDFLDSSIREFATYIAEESVGTRPFHFGSVRIGFVNRRTREGFARLSRQVDITKANLTENFDKLSEYLGQDEVELVGQLLSQLAEAIRTFPDSYLDLLEAGQSAVANLRGFLRSIGDSENFSSEIRGIV